MRGKGPGDVVFVDRQHIGPTRRYRFCARFRETLKDRAFANTWTHQTVLTGMTSKEPSQPPYRASQPNRSPSGVNLPKRG